MIHALGKASEGDRRRLSEILDSHGGDPSLTEEAISILNRYGSVEYARQKSRELVLSAWAEIEPLLRETDAKRKLKDFVYFLVERDF